MPSVLNPYISFRDQAREAITYYASILGGEPSIMTFGDAHMPGAQPDLVMHSQLRTPLGFTLMASDAPEGMPLDEGSRITISMSGDDADTLRGYFEALAKDGSVTLPLETQAWGDEFGMVTDKFGVAWMVDIAQPQQ